MDLDQAIIDRHSVRQYTDRKIEGEVLERLETEISRINAESGLDIHLFLDEPTAFKGFMLKATTGFKNAVNYFSIIGPESDHLNQDAGYYGEELVLIAQSLGLNTCWAMMASKKGSSDAVKEGERNVINISVGYGETQGKPHKSKPIEKFGNIEDAPEWYVKGIECAMLAPTGINRQGFRFERDGDRVRIIGGDSILSQIDTGIAMFHFEYGAGKENFTWMDRRYCFFINPSQFR